ncbi:MAG: T9SS type A sorting domain-containing protein [Phaeodactylibacter sp.]|nr:T9SS type A sorting domain-containing protein [Phaeodactylibacter sp.]
MVSSFAFQKWATDTWEDDYKWTLEYNGAGFETFAEQITYVDGVPENTLQRLSTYDGSNLLVERTFTKWQNDQWVNDRKLTYTHDADGLILDIITEKWAADMWNLQKKDVYEYDSADNPILITTSGYLGGDWIPVSQRISEFDSEGRVLNRLNQAYDLNNMIWVDQTLVYFYYEEFDFTVGLQDVRVEQLLCFPNPSPNGQFRLQIPELHGNALLKVYNREGQLLTLRPLQSADDTVDLSNLPNGLYYLKLDTPMQTWIGEIQLAR